MKRAFWILSFGVLIGIATIATPISAKGADERGRGTGRPAARGRTTEQWRGDGRRGEGWRGDGWRGDRWRGGWGVGYAPYYGYSTPSYGYYDTPYYSYPDYGYSYSYPDYGQSYYNGYPSYGYPSYGYYYGGPYVYGRVGRRGGFRFGWW